MLRVKHIKALAAVFLVMCVCAGAMFYGVKPFAEKAEGAGLNYFTYEESERKSFTVFIGGDVDEEDYYVLPAGIFYWELFAVTGFTDTAGYNLNDRVNPNTAMLISGFCLNINYADFADLAEVFGVGVAEKIVNYIAENGFTENKYILKNVLTAEEFLSVERKIYAKI